MTESLVRLLVAVLLIWGTFAIGDAIGKSLFGGAKEHSAFQRLVGELSSPGTGESYSFDVVLDKGNALIGISKNRNSFRCIECRKNGWKQEFKRPVSCPTGKSCVCLCRGAKRDDKSFSSTSEISCDAEICEPIDADILENLQLNSIDPNIRNARWDGGFIYSRWGAGRGPHTGFLETNTEKRYPAFIEKNGNGVAVCPKQSGCLVASVGGVGGGVPVGGSGIPVQGGAIGVGGDSVQVNGVNVRVEDEVGGAVTFVGENLEKGQEIDIIEVE